MKLQVTPGNFQELIKRSYSLDHIYLLTLIEQQFDIQPLCDGSMKVAALLSGLIRKGMVTDDDRITTLGIELLAFVGSKEDKKLIKRKPSTTEFEDWWKAFPGTDTFTYKGQKFTGSRSLRAAKDDCRLKFDKILLEGEYTAALLIEALNYDVLQKKEVSAAQKANKLTYMQNSLTYLNQRSYEPFIELIQEGVKLTTTSEIKGSTDI